MPHRRLKTAGLAVALCLSLPFAAAADDPVVATVNGMEIPRSDVIEAQRRLPEGFQDLPLETVFGMLVNSLVDSRLASAAAREQGLAEDEEFKRLMARIEEQILERMLLSRYIGERVTEEALRERHRTLIEDTAAKVEVRARHILVDSEAKAREVIAELATGADFAELAKTRSSGPSSVDGGDLGYFARDDLDPAFTEAAFALDAGTITENPVQTQFGWHVIKTEDRRAAAAPSFEEARPRLEGELSQQIGAEYLRELREAATVVRFKPDGSPLDQ